jgi:hypothetical protein
MDVVVLKEPAAQEIRATACVRQQHKSHHVKYSCKNVRSLVGKTVALIIREGRINFQRSERQESALLFSKLGGGLQNTTERIECQ